jgi:hypothetical protein
MIQNKIFALVFRILSFGFTLSGLVDITGILAGEFNPKMMMYYTNQSNLLALILFAILTYKTAQDIRRTGARGNAGYMSRFEMVCVINLMLTLIVFWVFLAPSMFSMDSPLPLNSFRNLAVHLIVPLLCLIDYILFSAPGHLKYRDIYLVPIFPLAYVLFSTVAGLSGYVYQEAGPDNSPVHFPYFFIDWYQNGARCLIYILAMTVVFLFFTHILYWVDRARSRKHPPSSSSE